MLPNAEDCPAGADQSEVGVAIPIDVALDLFGPVPAVGSVLTLSVIGAPVPEAAIDEHRHLHLGEDDVGLAAECRDGPAVHEVAQAAPV